MNSVIRFLFAIFFLFLTALFPCKVYAQQLPVNLRFSKFTTENGLSDNFIYDIIKDRKGYLWIATQNGLNRFDGVEFKTFFNNPNDTNSLLSNYVGSICEDSLGRIWAATSLGLSMYNPSTGKFWNFFPPTSKYIKSRVSKVCKARDGTIWFNTLNHLNTIDLTTFQIKSYAIDAKHPDLRKIAIGDFYEDHNGDFWFNSYHGLCLFDRITHQITVMDKDFGLSAFYDDGSGECWIGCWFQGLRNYNFQSKKFTDYFFPKKKDSSITRDIESIEKVPYKGLDSYLWVGTEEELALFDLRTKSFAKYYAHKAELPASLPTGFIYRIFYDGRNEIWFGTEHGLYYARLNQLAFQTYFFPGMEMNSVSRIREDVADPSCVRVGLYPGGILKVNKSTGEISDIYLPEKQFIYGLNYIDDFAEDANGIFWIGSHNGLMRYDSNTKQFRQLNQLYKGFDNEDQRIFKLLLNADSTFWFLTASGLGKFDIKTETFKYYPHYDPEQNKGNKDHAIRFAIKDYNDDIWLATKYEGLMVFNPRTEKFKRVFIKSEDVINVPPNDLIIADDSTIWYTTGDKVYFKKPADSLFHHLQNEKISGIVFGLITDKKNNLFIGTQTGLVEYEKAEGRFIKYTTTDGLYENRLSSGFDRGSDGELYLRGDGYITIIYPESLDKKYLPASLLLESMKVGMLDTAIDFSSYTSNALELNYSQNQFTVNFRLLNFEDAQMVNYQYMLEGWDKNWISSGTGNYASYSNLGGGDYTLHVKAYNPDGVENPQQASMMIHIIPPYWQTAWFRILIVLSGASLVYFIYRLRIQRLLAVERIRSQISRDLHDEIGASLSSMHIMSTFAEESLNTNSHDTRQWMHRIGNNTKEIMEKIRDIVWTLNSPGEITGNIITRMNLYISHTLEPKDIICNFDSDEKANAMLHDFVIKRNVYLIFKEAVNNAVKYSECTTVNIKLKMEDKKLFLSVADNGKGFDAVAVKGGNGLTNIRIRAEEIKAAVEINSSPGMGTAVSLLIPIPQLRYPFFKKAT